MKENILEEKHYDNTPASITLYKARANVLTLNDRKRHQNEETTCPLCKHEYEDFTYMITYMIHF
jgi:hypothetical protein